jgi:hypothetical protein
MFQKSDKKKMTASGWSVPVIGHTLPTTDRSTAVIGSLVYKCSLNILSNILLFVHEGGGPKNNTKLGCDKY